MTCCIVLWLVMPNFFLADYQSVSKFSFLYVIKRNNISTTGRELMLGYIVKVKAFLVKVQASTLDKAHKSIQLVYFENRNTDLPVHQ